MADPLPLFIFTKEDKDLIQGQSSRDPLGSQVVWSAVARHVIPHLTEQTNSVLGFQLLLSSFLFYEHYVSHINANWEDVKGGLVNRSTRQTFSLENVFILLEQAFAFSYFATANEWPLNGKRRVTVFGYDPHLSLKNQILSSQLATGVWGYYRGAAIRSGLLDATGRRLSEPVRVAMMQDGAHKSLLRKKFYNLISSGLLGESVDFPRRPGDAVVQTFAGLLSEIPQKRLLREYLLAPEESDLVKPLAELACRSGLLSQDPESWRTFFQLCISEFPDHAEHFRNVIRCTDYVGSLDTLFEWLLSFKGESVQTVAKRCSADLESLRRAQAEFSMIATFPAGNAGRRAQLLTTDIELESHTSLVNTLIRVHGTISDERGASRWIGISDNDRLLVETEPLVNADEPLRVSPGSGWRYDYYLTPLMKIFRGVK